MIITASYILPIDSAPIIDGAVLIDKGRIAALGTRREILAKYPSHPVKSYPNHILMPGLVNAHAHLELGKMEGEIPPGLDFTGWIRRLISIRSIWSEEDYEISAREGIERLLSCGTTAVGDISSTGKSLKLLEKAGLSGVVFLELIGFMPERAPQIIEDISLKLKNLETFNHRIKLGISPHAPYSVSAALFQGLSQVGPAKYPLSIHLAETAQESLFLEKGEGPFRELLQWRGVFDEKWKAPGLSGVQYLDNLKILSSRTLAVHLNYLSDADCQILAQNQVHAVTCPGSNRFFSRKNPHLKKLAELGVNIALGTDSLASNEDLNLFREMRLLHEDNPWLSFDKLLEIATLGGARALNMENQLGSLSAGKIANLIALPVLSGLAGDKISKFVVENALSPDAVILEGKII